MEGGGSFGAGRTGSTIDPIAFAKQPQTILRVLSWVRAFFFLFSPPLSPPVLLFACDDDDDDDVCVRVYVYVYVVVGVLSVVAACASPVTSSHRKKKKK